MTETVTIVRAADGTPVAEGGRGVPVTATLEKGVNVVGAEQLVWETATGGKELHSSKKVQGRSKKAKPIAMLRYMHDYLTNTLYAVTALDTEERTITIAKEGMAKNGQHVF